MSKFWSYVVAFFAGVAAVLYIILGKKEIPRDLPENPAKNDLENDIKKIGEEQKELKKNGPEKLTPDETIKYWSKQ